MNTALFDSIARIARHEAKSRAVAAIGRVVEQFMPGGASPDYAVSVELRDTGLVLPKVPVATSVMGAAAIPDVEDLVVVLFAEGDYHAPVVVGRLYHPDINPPKHEAGEITLQLPPGSDEPAVDLLVNGATPALTLKLPGDVIIEVLEEKVNLVVGKLSITLEAAGGGKAEIAAAGSTITLKEDGDITLSSAGKLVLEGTEIEIAGSAKVAISGGQVEIN